MFVSIYLGIMSFYVLCMDYLELVDGKNDYKKYIKLRNNKQDEFGKYPLWILESRDKNLHILKNNSNSNLKKAKFFFNMMGNNWRCE